MANYSLDEVVREIVDLLATRVAVRLRELDGASRVSVKPTEEPGVEIRHGGERPAAPAPEYVSTKDAAARIGLAPHTLRTWRVYGGGPPYCRLGDRTRGRVIYRVSELDDWLTSRTFRSTREETVRRSR